MKTPEQSQEFEDPLQRAERVAMGLKEFGKKAITPEMAEDFRRREQEIKERNEKLQRGER